jgi:hypothetical protein
MINKPNTFLGQLLRFLLVPIFVISGFIIIIEMFFVPPYPLNTTVVGETKYSWIVKTHGIMHDKTKIESFRKPVIIEAKVVAIKGETFILKNINNHKTFYVYPRNDHDIMMAKQPNTIFICQYTFYRINKDDEVGWKIIDIKRK